jgi:hypothetical protein
MDFKCNSIEKTGIRQQSNGQIKEFQKTMMSAPRDREDCFKCKDFFQPAKIKGCSSSVKNSKPDKNPQNEKTENINNLKLQKSQKFKDGFQVLQLKYTPSVFQYPRNRFT